MKIIAVIPARLNSTRLPNKLLRDICGKTLIRRTYEATKNSSLFDDVLVVTNSEEILKELKNNQIKFLFDKNQYQTGTDRIAGVASDINADISRLEGMGAVLAEGPIDMPNGMQIAFIKTPGNVRLELIQWPG